MTSDTRGASCVQTELVSAFSIGALSAAEASALEAHLAVCVACQEELQSFRRVVGSFEAWPADILPSVPSLWDRLVERLDRDPASAASFGTPPRVEEPEWEEVAPGISCQLLGTDTEHNRVSMLVRLTPGTDYPPHTHAGVEELHLLDGELWIDDRKLFAGGYYRAEAGTADKRVWSETGCTCVLVTSIDDRLS